MAEKQIPPERKRIYYAGMGLSALGFLLFISVFISGVANFGHFNNFEQRARSQMVRALVGMGMFVAGGILMRLGRRGLAGSGLKLDPEEARKDIEPWSRMAGGMVKDALDEAGVKPGPNPPQEHEHDHEHLSFDERLRRLNQLRQDGLISDAEFEATKKKILDEA